MTAAALSAGALVESVYVAADAKGSDAVRSIALEALERGARVFELEPGLMERVADTVTPQPICAVVAMADASLETALCTAEPGGERSVLVCVDVRDPGNLGAVVRSAAAAGVAAVVCCDGCADLYSPKAVRASAGAIFSVPVVKGGDVRHVLGSLHLAGFTVVGTSAREGTSYLEAQIAGDIAVVLGNEASGLPGDLAGELDAVLTIPMAADSESLNVAMTAAVLSFELARRRAVARSPGVGAGPPAPVA